MRLIANTIADALICLIIGHYWVTDNDGNTFCSICKTPKPSDEE